MTDEVDDLDLDGEDTEQPESDTGAEAAPSEGPDVGKLRKENRSLRMKLRRSELQTKYGQDVVELIPEELPIGKWASFAEKLATKLVSEQPQTDQATPGAPEEEPTPTEQNLAAVAKGSPSAVATGVGTSYERAEWDRLFKDPSTRLEAIRAAQEGRVRLNNAAAYDVDVKDKEGLFTVPG